MGVGQPFLDRMQPIPAITDSCTALATSDVRDIRSMHATAAEGPPPPPRGFPTFSHPHLLSTMTPDLSREL